MNSILLHLKVCNLSKAQKSSCIRDIEGKVTFSVVSVSTIIFERLDQKAEFWQE